MAYSCLGARCRWQISVPHHASFVRFFLCVLSVQRNLFWFFKTGIHACAESTQRSCLFPIASPMQGWSRDQPYYSKQSPIFTVFAMFHFILYRRGSWKFERHFLWAHPISKAFPLHQPTTSLSLLATNRRFRSRRVLWRKETFVCWNFRPHIISSCGLSGVLH